jgi:DNA-binding NarL/FixJ family response regulator
MVEAKRMIRVSIIDDCTELRESISSFLNGAPGFHCAGAYENAEIALQHLPADAPDVVLMDINLPGMSGIECVSRLKVSMPETQVLMVTVYEDAESIFNALAAGASGYLLKRLEPAKLLEAIAEVAAGGSPMSASIARKVVHSFQQPLPQENKQARLSAREKEVLERLARGRAYKQIADELGVSIDTIRTYIRRIYEKLQVRTRTEAVARYMTRSGTFSGRPAGFI